MTQPMTPREKVELKPCPFCAGKAELERFGNTRVSTIYRCEDCGCQLETGEEFNHGRAWNRRTALASGSGDHAELASAGHIVWWKAGGVSYFPEGENFRLAASCRVEPLVTAASAEALLAENAALRGERDRAKERMHKAIDKARDEEVAAQAAELQATEAERKLAEARTIIDEGLYARTDKFEAMAHTFLSSTEAERG
ncbi:Lar family restriction alleviation protein [Brevundimonas sp.]|uniref:Lar family restriction alleviation protein n=1 Tax=Brevundimonas sp. TaxID=1871086 RepID=UPI0025BC10EC|nr:Lar family restriction alleviation protein [Brevundimonas sp.]